MPIVIVTTAGDAGANSYASLADAEDYALTLPVANDWATATDAQKNAAIAQATRMLDSLDWKGYRAAPTVQALQWPRYEAYDREGYELNATTIPAFLRNATCEFAIRLISDDRAADSGGLAPETMKIGPLDLGKMRRQPIPASVLEMVREFLAAGADSPRMVRG